MEEYLYLIFDRLWADYQDQTLQALFLIFSLAVVSHWLVEKIMMAFVYDQEIVDRWKPVVFFVVDMLLLMLGAEIFDLWLGPIGIGVKIFVAVVISAVSTAVYYLMPDIFAYVQKYRLQRINGGSNGTSNGSGS